jgi:hypothetical protein
VKCSMPNSFSFSRTARDRTRSECAAVPHRGYLDGGTFKGGRPRLRSHDNHPSYSRFKPHGADGQGPRTRPHHRHPASRLAGRFELALWRWFQAGGFQRGCHGNRWCQRSRADCFGALEEPQLLLTVPRLYLAARSSVHLTNAARSSLLTPLGSR